MQWKGKILEMQLKGTYEQAEICKLQLPYIIPRQAIVKPVDTDKAGYPDVIVLDQIALADENL